MRYYVISRRLLCTGGLAIRRSRGSQHSATWSAINQVTCRSAGQHHVRTLATINGRLGESAVTDVELDNILLRGRRYGLFSVKDLDFQTDFRNLALRGRLLVDNNTLRPDLNLWCILADYAIADRGWEGAKDIHHALWRRGPSIPLDDDTSVTNYIWQRLLCTSLRARKFRFLNELVLTIVAGRSNLWSEIVGACIVNNIPHAKMLATWYRRKYYRGLEDTIRLYEVCQAGHVKGFVNFMSEVREDNYEVRGLYRIIMPRLWREERVEDALAMHNFLVKSADLPPTFGFLEPAIHELATHNQDLEPFIHRVAYAGGQFNIQAARAYQKSRENTSRARPLNFGEASTRDSWVARILATRGVSTDFVLNSLRMLSVRELGPLSIRQLGINAESCGELQRYLTKLKELDIDIGSSSYARLVIKLCQTNQETLLQQTLNTSIHHDVFEDETLLKKLTTERLVAQDWSQFNFLLAALHYLKVATSIDDLMCDMLLGLSVEPRFQRTILGVLDNWYSRAVVPVSQIGRLISELVHSMLYVETPQRRDGQKLAIKERFPVMMLQHVSFMAGVMQHALTHGVQVSVNCWKPVFRYFEECGQLNKFLRLSVWLARWYTPDDVRTAYSSNKSDVQKLFNDQWLKSYSHLALRTSFQNDMTKEDKPYHDMVNFLAYMQSQYGIHINTTTIVDAIHIRVHKQAKLVAWRRHRDLHHGVRTIDVAPMLLKLKNDIRRRFDRDAKPV